MQTQLEHYSNTSSPLQSARAAGGGRRVMGAANGSSHSHLHYGNFVVEHEITSVHLNAMQSHTQRYFARNSHAIGAQSDGGALE